VSWDALRANVASGLAWLRGREVSTNTAGVTQGQAILEAIVELDSDQADAVETLGSGNLIEYRDDGSVRPGRLQRIEQIRAYFFGDSATGEGGLFDAMREAEDPAFLENPEG